MKEYQTPCLFKLQSPWLLSVVMLGSGSSQAGPEFRVHFFQGLKSRVEVLGSWVSGLGSIGQSLGSRVQGSGPSRGLGSKVLGLA
eukprot:2912424-Rhodomonas_salina.3